MSRRIANIRNRNTTVDEVDSGRQHVDALLFILTHTYCVLVVLLENWGDVSGLLLFLLCIVLD